MLSALMTVVVPVVLIIVVGMLLERVVSNGLEDINRIALYGLTPALIFDSISTSSGSYDGIARLLLGYGLFLGAMVTIAWLVSRGVAGSRQRNFIGMSVFVNGGNMMLPITLFALGQAGLDRALVLFAVTLILQVTIGPYLFAGRQTTQLPRLRFLPMGPIVGAVCLGVCVKLCSWNVPIGVARGIGSLGSAAIPMVLLTLGLQVGRSGFRYPKASAWGVMAVRLVLGPVLGFVTGYLVGARDLDLGVLTLIAAMPPAVINYMFALEFGEEADEVARTLALATGASILTLSIVVALVTKHVA